MCASNLKICARLIGRKAKNLGPVTDCWDFQSCRGKEKDNKALERKLLCFESCI